MKNVRAYHGMYIHELKKNNKLTEEQKIIKVMQYRKE